MKNLSDKMLRHLRQVTDEPDLQHTKYRLIQKIGSGGMGSVFLVEDTALKRRAAMKALNLPDGAEKMSERMMREAQIIARLEHPGIVPIHDTGVLPDQRIFYVMKYVQGSNLKDFIHSTSVFSERLRIFRKICEAVAFAHANGVVHRDLKPENIMIGDFGEALVMDWGIAKFLASNEKTEAASLAKKDTLTKGGEQTNSKTLAGTIMGTPGFMAPEQSAGNIADIDNRSDIYALGAILYFLLTEKMPPASENALSLNNFPLTSAQSQQKIPKLLKHICIKAMAVSKSERYQNALSLAKDIDQFRDDEAISAYRENPLEMMWRFLKKYKFFVGLILAYLLIRFLMLFWLNI